MGIDIRDGAQLECINCGLCIDACDEIMDKVGRPRGLIAYDTDAAVAARNSGQKPQHKLIRPRTLYYGLALAVVGGLMIWGFATRETLGAHALRDRNPAWVRLSDGAVRNGYTLKITNRGFEPASVDIRYAGVPGAVLRAPGRPETDPLRVVVEPNRVTAVRVFVTAPSDEAGAGSRDAAFEIRSGDRTRTVRTAFDYGTPQP
jgi:polyferredoxin